MLGQPEPTKLLDTADFSDAILTGRERVEDLSEGEPGLQIEYVCGRSRHPSITLHGPDGEVCLSGLAEIEHVVRTLERGARLARRDCERNSE